MLNLSTAERLALLKLAKATAPLQAPATLTPIEPVDRGAPLALSFAQQRLWFVEQLGDLGGTYHIPTRLRLKGALDRDALARALDRIVARHEALRTTFHSVDGKPVQRIASIDESRFPLAEIDLRGRPDADAELRRLIEEETAAPFDLARGPLVRGRLVRRADDDHVLLVTMHHIVSDGWSMGIFTRELGALYAAFQRGEPDPLPPLPVQYADYAAWQRKWVDGDVLRAQAEYWKTTLSSVPELLELPADRARPAQVDFAGATVSIELDEALTASLKALSERQGTTLFMTLLAGWAMVMGRLAGQRDVVIGTPAAGRNRREIEGLIGFFVNTLAVRVDVSGAPTVAELLGRVKERALGAQDHQDIPFEQVVELLDLTRSLAHHPLFQVMFAWQNTPRTGSGSGGGAASLPGLQVGGVGEGSAHAQAKFDLTLTLSERDGRIAGAVEYATALFDRATVERFAGYFRRALEAMAADEHQLVDRLSLLSDDERRLVVDEWNRTDADFPRDSTVHALFEAQAARTPDAAAVVFDGEEITYAELNARSNRLAHHLRSLGVGSDVRVALAMPRSPALVEAELAILKCGGVYVPLDPEYPQDRLRWMLEDSAPAALLTTRDLADRFAGLTVPVIVVDAEASAWDARPATNLSVDVTADLVAYVIYTSGSTGRPKGVMVPHRAIARLVINNGYADFGADDRIAFAANPAFDASTMEVWAPLLNGGAIVIINQDTLLDPARFGAALRDNRVTALWLTVGLFNQYAEVLKDAWARLRYLIVGGDALDPRVISKVLRDGAPAHLLNGYGPTETTTFAITHRIERVEDGARSIPLGRPISNTRIYLLDGAMEPVPVGVAGEVHIGGDGLARGYLGRPDLTAERFIPNPFSADEGTRLYRTGDLARWLADGTIEFLGRADTQVKVRGFRIELGEIEARLLEHAAIREAIVLAREDAPGDKRLVAYVVGDDAIGAEALRAHLAERLPAYMVPAAYVWLGHLPLTPNGKVDRRALPAPEDDAYSARAYEAPLGETEQALAEIWSEVLGIERVGRNDSFFDLGGHSLLAVQVISRVRQVLEVEVALRELFTRPVLADFVRELETASHAELPPIELASREGRIPLSFAQQRLWFLEQLGDAGTNYHIRTPLRLRGALDRAALVRALDAIVARHEALRTTFAQTDGVPEQRIASAESSRFHLLEHDLAGEADASAAVARLMAEEAATEFDLERGPLIRGRLVRLADDEHLLLLTMHHIVSDGWSMGVLTRELSALYAAYREGREPLLPTLPVQYADYAAWQRRWVEGRVLQEQADYWARTLADVPEVLELPADHSRPAAPDHVGAQLGVMFDEETTAALKALSRRHGTTLYMALLAGWAVVLSRLSGQDDVVIGSPMAGRGRKEIEGLIGFFVNTLALRIDLSGAPTVAELLRRVKERAIEAQHHQDIPFEQVVDLAAPVRSLAHHPLFQVTFAWQNTPDREGEGLSLPGVKAGKAGVGSAHVTANVDLWMGLWEANGRIVGGVTYATALFERETVARQMGYLGRVLREMAADDGQPVAHLPLMPDAERARMLGEWNRTEAAYPREQCIHELFERQVDERPGAPAVVFDGKEITYAELNRRANRLARHLRALGVGADERVGICVERSPEMVVGVLGVLKAGGAYVPLDPSYPADRLRYMLEDAAPRVVLSQSSIISREAPLFGGIDMLPLDERWEDEEDTNLGRAAGPANLAYVIYTSGSTGRPKGVMVPHRNVAHLVVAQAVPFGAGEGSRVLQFSSFSFDACVLEMFSALCTGAALVLPRGADLLAGERLERTVAEGGVTHVILPPAVLPTLEGSALAPVHTMLLAGEALSEAAVQRWAGGRRLINGYGPTEATVWATAHECRVDERGDPPIGTPLTNTRVYVLDGGFEPLPVGVPGELYIGGEGVARGYLGRPGLTAERFVPDEFGGEPGARMYRTGDRVRWMDGAKLDFIGRVDHQVKLRGFRIELGEIEARLAAHPAVREAVVIAREDTPGDKRLVAYVVGDDSASAEVLRAYLAETLPEYMVPAAYLRMDALPLTPNGKLDRKALPSPEGDAFARRAYEAPVGETEEMLARLWAEVLGVERVSRWDDFFELGGHSLLAVQVISLMEVEVDLRELFNHPVLADFAREMEKAGRAELPPIERAPRDGRLPLSFAQQRLWFLEQMGDLGSTYHVPLRMRFRGDFDRDAFVRALDRIVARHEALRTTFVTVDGVPAQRIAAPDIGFHLIEHDLTDRPDELERWMAQEARAPFSLAHGPLIRGRLIRTGEDHIFLLTMHHVVTDGWSMGVLTRELGALYDAFRAGAADPLPPLPIQYADYAAWQRRWVEGDVLREQSDYWKAMLGGAPELLELPTDHPRPAQVDHAGAQVGLAFGEALTEGLRALSLRHGATLFMTLLAGWAAVLSRVSNQGTVVIGTPSAGRGRQEIEDLIGFFVNTLAVRVDLDAATSVADLLEQVKARALDAQQNQDIPFEQVVELVDPARSTAHTPIFQAMFTWQTIAKGGMSLPGLEMDGVRTRSSTVHAKFDLSLTLSERGGRIAGNVEYATALFERETIERHVAWLRRVLEEMVADERQRISRIPLLSSDERRVLMDWGRAGAIDAGDGGVHEWFEAHAGLDPSAVAVVDGGREVTYGELNARANRLARHLVSLGVGADARVAVCGERSPELIAALLAVLKAGAAYVPIDPGHPDDRLRYILEDCAPVAVLTNASLAARFGDVSVPLARIDDDAAWSGESGDDLGAATSSTQAAYVIYTSGSTGQPKGVVVEHHSVRQQVAALQKHFGLRAEDRVLQFASFTFDASVEEIFGALGSGSALVLRSEVWLEGADAFWARCDRHGVTVVDLPTRFWQLLSADEGARIPPDVRLVVTGGEAVDAASVEAWFRRGGHLPRLLNSYGPTETTVNATFREMNGDPAAWRSIGRPVAGSRAYLVAARGELAPTGVVGELLVGGGQVSRGYLGRPALTAERFVPDAFGGEAGARLYRTGDLGRWRNDGEIEFTGRADFQVKIRGFRIELGEIEARLAEHPAVRDSVVVALDDAGDKRLVAYVAADEGLDVDALRAHLAERLPAYMVPAAFVRLDAFPLTSGGKVDRRALPAPDGDAYATRAFEAPQGETETTLAAIWAEVLRIDRVGRRDSFFELGGHSLLAVQVISRVRQALEVEVSLGDLFTRPILADFARGLETAARAQLPPIERVARDGRLPLSFAQQRLWFLEQMGGLGSTYHISQRMRLRGELDRAALGRTLDAIVARHEALRTTFAEVAGVPEQRIAPADAGFHLVEHDLAGDENARSEFGRLTSDEQRTPFDLRNGPLIRGRLIRIAPEDHVLLLTMHHIVSDGWSMEVLTRELGALYAAYREGRDADLPDLPVQYADYAAWQRDWVDGDVLRAQSDYWKATLSGSPELLELRTDHPRPARQDFAGAALAVEIDPDLTSSLEALSARHGTTLFMTLLAGWSIVLGRLAGQDDVVIGTPAAGRGRREIEGLIGFFVNTLALRVDLSGSPSVGEVLARVKARALEAQHHQDIPFEQVVELVSPGRIRSHSPLFQVMFAWQNTPREALDLPGLGTGSTGTRKPESTGKTAASGAMARGTSRYDMTLSLQEAGGRITGGIEYATSLFERRTVERFLGYLNNVLAAMVRDDAASVHELPMMAEAERRQVLGDWNDDEDVEFSL